MTKIAAISGVERDIATVDFQLPETLGVTYELTTLIEVSETRSSNKENAIPLEGNELIILQFTDDTEWIGHPEDVQELYDKTTLLKRSSSSSDYIFDTQITTEDPTRGLIKRVMVKLFGVIKPKAVASVTMAALAQAYDKKIQPHPGLYKIDKSFNRIAIKEAIDTSQTNLLFLHGTLSTAIDAFNNLSNTNTWQKIVSKYSQHILALEHYTLATSPLQNALAFLESCPDNLTIDIISHSRGGLVADILAKCDYRNAVIGFSNNELEILKNKDEESKKLMIAINGLARKKRLKITKVIRVAAPSSGTTILSRRVDHFFNLLLNSVSLALGFRNPIYEAIKGFLLELVSQKEDPEILPGLNSMMPESLFQKMLNAGDTSVVSELYNIAGDSEVGGVNLESLKVILANLFYRSENDLVVDTKRMLHGVQRAEGMHNYISQSSNANHFNYFSNEDSCKAILEALGIEEAKETSVFTRKVFTKGQRGILLDLLSLEGVSYDVPIKNISRDVVILIPGIMGSTLSRNKEDQWVDMRELNKGCIPKQLNISADKVEANGVIKKYYGQLAEYLSKDYDVITLQFDWRKSVREAARVLKNKLEAIMQMHEVSIHVVAHSMGGVVARQCMINHANTWKTFKENEQNKFVMLGTPWMGSYLIMEVLTGHSKRVKQLAAIDFKHDRADLLTIFWKYPGIFELLPLEKQTNNVFEDVRFWEALQERCKLKHMPSPTSNTRSLGDFADYKTKTLTYLDGLESSDFDNIFYICGKADKTVFNYRFKDRFFSRKDKLIYLATNEGDGSVTWATGIPKQLMNSERLFYTNTTHGNLANEPAIFDGIAELLKTGRTNKLSTQRPSLRGGEVITEVHDYAEPLYNSDAVVKALFNTGEETQPETEAFTVKIIHGDLKTASYPVVVGHFFSDLILSAEKALDEYLNYRLSQRMEIGYYPGKIGESEVFFNLNTQPKGAIVCGLGSTETLTPYLLSKTVRLAVLKYAMFMRDNYTLPKAKKYANGMSFILMGIGYGKLPIEDSIKGILLGVASANEQIRQTGDGLKAIKDIEVINYYESIASQAYFSFTRLKNSDDRIVFNVEKGISKRTGAKKRQQFHSDEYDWWYNLHINSMKNTDAICSEEDKVDGFNYYSSNGLARVEQEMVGIGLHKINHLVEEMSSSAVWDSRLSKSLFEMLVPNEFKNTFRNQAKIVLKLDKDAAQIPWELLHDFTTSKVPASVSSGFIRQLVTEDAGNFRPVALNVNEVLVVGDPQYHRADLRPLQAAKVEAEWVAEVLENAGYTTHALINRNAKDIMMDFFSRNYKIMHFAGHGVYDSDNCDIGIAIGNGISIDPAMINQLGYVPEFVFINCCFSGVIATEDETYSRNRYRLAANVGTQLIEMGVKAIVISGWAVDDAAAKTFSETFYQRMLQGYDFGSAVQMARLDTYQNHKGTNTWGAYQCYGNQFYKFKSKKKSKQSAEGYVVASQVHTDLDNLLVALREKKEDKHSVQTKLNTYLDRAQECNLLDAMVLEKEALIYDELGMNAIAYQKYKTLFAYDNGNYSIKALEQYCIVQAHLVEEKLKQAQQGKQKTKTLKIVEEYITEIAFLTLAGKNASRLNIVGNAYKLTAKYLEIEKKIEHLNIAFNYYEEAYKSTSDKYDGQSLDAESNRIFIAYFLKLLKDDGAMDRILESKGLKNISDLDKYLEEFYKELDDYDTSDLDISVLIGMTEVSYCRILLTGEHEVLDKKILRLYKETFELLFSARYIKIEISQINFLLNFVSSKTVIERLEYIRGELFKYLK